MTLDNVPTNPGLREQRSGHVYLHALIEDASVVIDLVNFVHQTRRTGVLTVVSGPLRKSIYFNLGSVIAAASNQPEDRFGNIMVRLGLITRETMEQALREVGPRRRIGNVLISRGCLTTKDLWRIIRVQIEEVLYSVLLLEQGELTLAHFDATQVPNRTALNTQHVLLEALRRKDEMVHLRSQLPPGEQILVRLRPEAGVTLTEKERRVYEQVDGHRSVDAICADSGLGELEATRVLNHLLKVGLVAVGMSDTPTVVLDLVTGADISVSTIVGAFNEGIHLINDALQDAGHIGLIGHGIDTFFNDLDVELGELFDGVVPRQDGHLPPDRLFRNLKVSRSKEKIRLLRRGLSEYVQFLMFLARETLEHDVVERLARRVKDQLQGFDA